jgi:hypothetical protein
MAQFAALDGERRVRYEHSVTLAAPSSLPFGLAESRDGGRHGYWGAEKLHVMVAASTARDALLATLHETVAGWRDLAATVARFVRDLDGEALVPLEPASLGGFSARTCGFQGELVFGSISVTDVAHLRVTFCTGFPDGYVTFAVVIEDGVPVRVVAFAS